MEFTTKEKTQGLSNTCLFHWAVNGAQNWSFANWRVLLIKEKIWIPKKKKFCLTTRLKTPKQTDDFYKKLLEIIVSIKYHNSKLFSIT